VERHGECAKAVLVVFNHLKTLFSVQIVTTFATCVSTIVHNLEKVPNKTLKIAKNKNQNKKIDTNFLKSYMSLALFGFWF
jgi:hypothetical protein